MIKQIETGGNILIHTKGRTHFDDSLSIGVQYIQRANNFKPDNPIGYNLLPLTSSLVGLLVVSAAVIYAVEEVSDYVRNPNQPY